MNNQQASLSGRRVLVTGAGGFIGSHLCEALARRGAMVRAFVHYRALRPGGWLDDAEGNFDIMAGDIADAATVRRAVAGCDIVWHLAALIGIPYSYNAPLSYVRTNIEGTLNVLEAAREHGTARVVTTSTSEVYGTAQFVPINEDHSLNAQSPYAATKIAADQLALSFHRTHGVPVVIARPFNTYGPRQSQRAIVPTIIAQVLAGRDVVHLGALHPTRDLTFVGDTAEGLIACGTAPDAAVGQVFNLGTGREVSIGDLAAKIQSIAGHKAPITCDDARLRPAASEVERLLADSTRAAEALGWRATTTLDEGLRSTIAWFRNRSGNDASPAGYVV